MATRSLRAPGVSLTALARDERGATFVEYLLTFPLVLLFFLGLFQYAVLCGADLIVQRAASAAVRAAVTYLPDDPAMYDDPSPAAREAYVREAARRVLLASVRFDPRGLSVTIDGTRKGSEPITATVRANFRCLQLVGWLCGADRSRSLSASARLPYQGSGG